jgi:hypothetical protein
MFRQDEFFLYAQQREVMPLYPQRYRWGRIEAEIVEARLRGYNPTLSYNLLIPSWKVEI